MGDIQLADADSGDEMNPSRPITAAEVTEVARGVITRLAPEELAVFDAVAQGRAAEPRTGRKAKRAPGATVGFGVEAVLLSQLAFSIITGALGDILGTAAMERSQAQRLRHRRRAARAVPGRLGNAAPASRAGRRSPGRWLAGLASGTAGGLSSPSRAGS
jgi:hypothetical protein